MADDRPAWARRMYNERQARGWSQADAVRAMRAHYSHEHPSRDLPDSASLLRQYKRWEAGEVEPDRGRAEPLYKPIIAAEECLKPVDVPGRGCTFPDRP